MAEFLKQCKAFWQTLPGQVIQGVVYAILLILVCMFFTGNGEFIYEAF